MKFVLLTRFHANHPQGGMAKRLIEESNTRGHEFIVINPQEVSLAFGGGPESIQWKGAPFPPCDLVHYAVRWDDDHTWAVVETLKAAGFKVLPPHRVPMGDSITMARLFARHNIATPKTWVFAGAPQMQLVAGELPFPCLFRVRRNTGGRRVFVAEHTGEALQLAENLGANGYPFLVQEIVAPTGNDVRAFVVGGKVVCAIERVAPAGYVWPREDGNSRATPTTVTPDEEKLAVAAAKVYNAPYAAVSIVRRAGHMPLLLELSRAPTLTEVERVTGVNVAGEIVAYCAAIAAGTAS